MDQKISNLEIAEEHDDTADNEKEVTKSRSCSSNRSLLLLGSGSVFAAIVVGVIIYVLPMFNNDDDGGDYVIPLLKPPVEESAPTSLQDASSRRRLRFDLYPPIDHRRLALDATDVKSRFFSTSATNVYDILDDIDDRINEFNRRGVFSCINDVAAVPYSFEAFGNDLTFYASCAENLADDPATPKFIQWGYKNSTTFNIYMRGGATIIAGELMLSNDVNRTVTDVMLYYSVGVSSDLTQSHGVATVRARPREKYIEMAVAGVGIGYCGAQLRADENRVYIKGSARSGPTCDSTDDVCVLASDVTVTSTCTAAQKDFSLTAIGRQAISGTSVDASDYPGGASNQVIFSSDGMNDHTDFGPTEPAVAFYQPS